MKIQVFWNKKPCRLVNSLQLFRESCRLLDSEYTRAVSSKRPVTIYQYTLRHIPE
jgi:hypothetical protein